MPSQFGDADLWQCRTRPDVPAGGEEQGRAIRYAEAFEVNRYGRQPTVEELKRLFPTFE